MKRRQRCCSTCSWQPPRTPSWYSCSVGGRSEAARTLLTRSVPGCPEANHVLRAEAPLLVSAAPMLASNHSPGCLAHHPPTPWRFAMPGHAVGLLVTLMLSSFALRRTASVLRTSSTAPVPPAPPKRLSVTQTHQQARQAMLGLAPARAIPGPL